MDEFYYALIRFVPNPERMEPMNVGIILQGQRRIDFKLSPHAAKRKIIDTDTFGKWRRFFLEEIRGEDRPLFQPEKSSLAFLRYLAEICQETVLLTRPLLASYPTPATFDHVLETLYQRLVAPPELVSPEAAIRPAGRFRQIQEEKRFLQRGMKRHAHVSADGELLWMAYRQLENGELIALDKVEVANQIGSTSNEIERLPRIANLLPRFGQHASNHKSRRHFLLADEMTEPFTGQLDAEFRAMQDDLEKAVAEVGQAGSKVLRTRRQVEELADELDGKLPHMPAE